MIELYSFKRNINGRTYEFDVPCEDVGDAQHLALRMDCVIDPNSPLTGETQEVCVNCYKNPSVRKTPKVLHLLPKTITVL